jgi:hypothetical protein
MGNDDDVFVLYYSWKDESQHLRIKNVIKYQVLAVVSLHTMRKHTNTGCGVICFCCARLSCFLFARLPSFSDSHSHQKREIESLLQFHHKVFTAIQDGKEEFQVGWV